MNCSDCTYVCPYTSSAQCRADRNAYYGGSRNGGGQSWSDEYARNEHRAHAQAQERARRDWHVESDYAAHPGWDK